MPLQMGGRGGGREMRPKVVKFIFFLFLSNKRAEVTGGELGASVNKQREGK